LKFIDKIKKNINLWYFAGLVIIMVSVAAFFAIRAEFIKKNSYAINKSLDQIVISVGKDKIPMKEAVYYILVVESNTNEMALKYNENNPLSYWNMWINNEFVSNIARDSVVDTCIRDNIYYQEAKKEGFELSKAEEDEAYNQAKKEHKALTTKQYELTKYNLSEMYAVIKKIHLVKKYLNSLMLSGLSEEELDIGGNYYNDLKTKYKITKNDEVWEQISLGRLSIN